MTALFRGRSSGPDPGDEAIQLSTTGTGPSSDPKTGLLTDIETMDSTNTTARRGAFEKDMSEDTKFDSPSNWSKFFNDLALGLADGLTVPFALTAGLSGFGNNDIVKYGGLAEVMAGSISMSVGGFLSSKGDVGIYRQTLKRTTNTVHCSTARTDDMIRQTLSSYSLPPRLLDDVVSHLNKSPERAVDFIMEHHHHQDSENATYIPALKTAFNVGLGYFVGGMCPLIPYFWHSSLELALFWSSCITIAFLLGFGFIRVWFTEGKNLLESLGGGLSHLIVGTLAVVLALACTRLLPTVEPLSTPGT